MCWKLAQSPKLTDLYCAPGNPGIAALASLVPIAADDVQDLADFAADLKIDLTVVGPELPLTLGIVDEFARRGLAVFGPSRAAARLEGSKVYAKRFMETHGIPTAEFEVAHDADSARQAARRFGFPVVLKADGLAAGKGVILPDGEAALEEALGIFFEERRFGTGGEHVVVERCLEGEEISLIAVCDGQNILPLASSKDYKRIGDGDEGPNTGGMGAHSPSGVLAPGDARDVLDQVMRPVVDGMAAEGQPFRGFLYAGLMLTAEGPRVLEFNVRLGDPEAQPLLMRLEDDLLEVLEQGASGSFRRPRLGCRQEAAACVVLAAAGYPEAPVTGDEIEGLEAAAGHDGAVVFHAATRRDGDRILTAGGRVLNVCATGAGLREALRGAYRAAAEIRWPNRTFRTDIGKRVLARLESSD